jgi:hypothetical protein
MPEHNTDSTPRPAQPYNLEGSIKFKLDNQKRRLAAFYRSCCHFDEGGTTIRREVLRFPNE